MVVVSLVATAPTACDDPAATDTATLAGAVLLPDGAGLAGTALFLGPPGGDARWTATSGADGSYSISADPGDWLLTVMPTVGYARPHDAGDLGVHLVADETTTLDVDMVPNVTVEVTREDSIQGGTFVGVDGATIQVTPHNGQEILAQGTTDAQGVWQLAAELGVYDITVILPEGFELRPEYDPTRTLDVAVQGAAYWIDFGARVVP